VTSTNGGMAGGQCPSQHAEARLARKLDYGSVVYVSRTLKNGDVALAKPCARCYAILRGKGVRKVFYTINESEYGVIYC